jgi:hypothetical protein
VPNGGRACLEIASTSQGTPSFCFIEQTVAVGTYRGKRVRFRAYLKTEGVADAAFASMGSYPGGTSNWADTSGKASGGTTGWRPHEVVIDVPADAKGLTVGVTLRGAGTLGVDDASLEIVDPAKVPVTAKPGDSRPNPEQRARELAEAYKTLSDRPENLDFER